MAKNASIQENGVAEAMTAINKLRTNLIGGGSCNWVPEDETLQREIIIRENGTYNASTYDVNSFSRVVVAVTQDSGNGGSVIGRMPDGNEYEFTVDDGGEIVTTKLPSSIAVTTLPSKLSYNDGDAIDFTGLVVTAFDGNGESMGEVPFNELVFPVTTATSISSGDDTVRNVDLGGLSIPMGSLSTPNTRWTAHVTSGNWAFCDWAEASSSIVYYHYYTPTNPDATIYIYLTQENNPYIYCGNPEDSLDTYMFYMLNDKYGMETENTTGWAMAEENFEPRSGFPNGFVFSGNYKTVFLSGGNRYELDGLGLTVPVQWASGSGVLETSFTVSVKKDNSWSGSGGGTF